MTRTKLILSIVAVLSLMLSLRAYSQEPNSRSEVRTPQIRMQLVDAEIGVKMQELELKMSELAVDEATVELEKIELHLEAIHERGDSREVGRVKLELKQAAIRVEMRKTKVGMARLQIERARAGWEHIRTGLNKKSREPSSVQVEYLDDLNVIVIRGAKENVDQIKALIEGAEKEEKVTAHAV